MQPQKNPGKDLAEEDPAAMRLNSKQATFTERLQTWWAAGWLPALLVGVITFLAYTPCLQGELVWDDDAWTLKLYKLLQNLSGLGVMWTKLTALQQYFPLTATTFWIDYQLWGFWTRPYHIENVLLHLVSALLFWKLLRRLEIPGAGLAAAILALHPLMVESVAWITERKNVLSLALFLGALLSYGRFAQFWTTEGDSPGSPTGSAGRDWKAYGLALVLFLGAYFAKATAFSFPAVLLLIAWWKRGRLCWRPDVLPALPFFGLSIGLGLVTFWLERNHVGAKGPEWNLSLLERCLIAGRALWFYVGKLLWPVKLCFVYPRWNIDTRSFLQWVYPLAAVGCALMLWLARRRIGRGPLAAALFFAGTLFPLLGFLNGYFMRYSFVCDHWSYLPSLGLIALGSAIVKRELERVPRLSQIIPVIILLALAILTWRQSAVFSDAETLYVTTLARNPNADLAHNNLGIMLVRAGYVQEAIEHFQRAVKIRPGSAHAHNNLANALRLTGHEADAAAQYEISLKLEPADANTSLNLATLLATSYDASVRNGSRAVELAEQANKMSGGTNPVALGILASAYAEAGRFKEAVSTAEQALQTATERSNLRLVNLLQMQLKLYEQGSAFHEPEPEHR